MWFVILNMVGFNAVKLLASPVLGLNSSVSCRFLAPKNTAIGLIPTQAEEFLYDKICEGKWSHSKLQKLAIKRCHAPPQRPRCLGMDPPSEREGHTVQRFSSPS